MPEARRSGSGGTGAAPARARRRVVGRAALGLSVALALSAPEIASAAEPTTGAGEQAPPPSAAASRRPRQPLYEVRPDPLKRGLMWVTGGLTLAGIAVGSTFGGLAISTWDDTERILATSCSDPARLQGCRQPVGELSEAALTYAQISTFAFITAGAALCGTVVLGLMPPPVVPRTRIHISLGVLGGSVRGEF